MQRADAGRVGSKETGGLRRLSRDVEDEDETDDVTVAGSFMGEFDKVRSAAEDEASKGGDSKGSDFVDFKGFGVGNDNDIDDMVDDNKDCDELF